MDKKQFLIQFIKKVQSRSSLNIFLTSLLKMLMAAGFLSVLVSAFFIFQGFHVPWGYPAIFLGVSLIATAILTVIKKPTLEESAQNGDHFFGLKDRLVSAFSFMNEGKNEGVFDLQSDDTYSKISKVDPNTYPIKISTKLLGLVVLLLLTTGALLQVDDSPAVKKEKQVAIETSKKSKEIKDELEKKIEELLEGLDDEERDKIKKSKLFEMVKKLDAEKTPEKLALKIAKLEKKLKDLMKKNNTKSEEKLLSKLAKELKDKKKLDKLGKALSKKDLKNADKELEKLKLEKLKNAKNKKELKKELEKKWKDKLKSWKKLSKAMKKSLKASSMSKNSLSEEFDKFSQSTDKLASEIEKLEEMDPKEWEKIKKQLQECQSCKNAGNKSLGKMAKSIKGLGKKKAFYMKMDKLKKSMQQCQSYAMGMRRVLAPGGKKAGTGADAPNRKESNQHQNNDQYTKLKGVKGSGKSFIKVEAAASGTGVSRAAGIKQSTQAKKQVEAFIQREEVPAHLKEGVKKYFIDVHGTLQE